MTETFQILILLLAVISVVGLVAKRLQIPPAILLVITGVGLALIPGLPTLQLAPDLVLVLVLPPDHLLGRGEDELEGIPLQPPPDRAAGDRLRRVHHGRRRGGDPLAVGLSLGGRFRPGRHYLASRRGGAAWRSRSACSFQGACSSFSRARDWPMTRRRSSFIASRSWR